MRERESESERGRERGVEEPAVPDTIRGERRETDDKEADRKRQTERGRQKEAGNMLRRKRSVSFGGFGW